MSQIEDDSFEKQWQKAMQKASTPPPQGAWPQIEAELDRKKRRGLFVPFWQLSSGGAWAVAASFAVLLAAVGWWTLSGSSTNKNTVAQKQLNEPSVLTTSPLTSSGSGSTMNQVPTNHAIKIPKTENKPLAHLAFDLKKLPKSYQSNQVLTTALPTSELPAPTTSRVDISQDIVPLPSPNAANVTQSLSFEPLNPKTWRLNRVAFTPRYVFYAMPTAPEKAKKASSKTYWTGLNLMPASFNPYTKISPQSVVSLASQAGVSINDPTLTMSFAPQTGATRSVAAGNGNFSQSAVSFSVQLLGGVQLSKHWSLESGLSYLRGNSTYKDYFRLSNQNTSLDFAFSDNQLGNNGSKSSPAYNNAVTADGQSVSNVLQFLQIPLQVGYTIAPARKLSLTILGGVFGNILLRNSINNNAYSAGEAQYNAINLAATTGVRLNYRLSGRWAATLTGTYQRALGSENTAQSLVQTRPQMLGLGFGLRYGF